MKTGLKILGAVAAGVVVGSIAGILLAPRSGKETRKIIADKSGDMKDKLADSIGSVIDEVKESYSELASAASNGKKTTA